MVVTMEELSELKKGILTPEQVAEILGLSVHTLEKWRVKGRNDLPFFKIGRNVRYRAQDVAAFLEPKLKPERVRDHHHHARKAA